MARKLKPVDDTPICDPAYIKRIDPVWRSGRVPPRFWEDRAHRHDYLLWLASRLGFRVMSDFYRLTARSISGNHGSTVLRTYWRCCPYRATNDVFFQYEWQEWLFPQVSKGFLESRQNRLRYMAWLGRQVGYRRAEDWYALTENEFLRNRGKGMLSYYHSSPVRAVFDLFPEREWHEWKFNQVPSGFWDVAENRHRYMRWLGKELGFRRATDWYRIRVEDIRTRHGAALLARFATLWDLMREFLPELDWDRVDWHRSVSSADILTWADAYYSRHGEWPTQKSGKIPESGDTWRSINECLTSGRRGLPGGSSLPKFLKTHRGVEPCRRPPRFSYEQILAWAHEHFKLHGKTPKILSGPILGTKENWWNVDNALRLGLRGMPGGSSLAKLLRRHGLK